MTTCTRDEAIKHTVNVIDWAWCMNGGERPTLNGQPAPELEREIVELICSVTKWKFPRVDGDVDRILSGQLKPEDWSRLSGGISEIMHTDDMHEVR